MIEKSSLTRLLAALLIAISCLSTDGLSQQRKSKAPPKKQVKTQPARAVSADIQSALERISADSMRGHLSFLASDLLEGRGTPSRGLEIAAEYIAAQFRRAGVEPGGDANEKGEKSYFQTANWFVTEPNTDAFSLTINDGTQTISLRPNQVSVSGDLQLSLSSTPMIKVDYKNAEALAALKSEQVQGKLVLTEIPDFRREDRSKWGEMSRAQNEFLSKVRALNPAFILSVDRVSPTGRGLGGGRLIDPERTPAQQPPAPQFISIHDSRAVNLYDSMNAGEVKGSANLTIAPGVQKPSPLKNVIGVLRGSDPVLKDTYVLVSAHYDHVGADSSRAGDGIFNGANDDGSGTVSVIELASALSGLKQRPKRSIAFIAWFGEERGLLGSRYYGKHPAFPLEKTVAMVNLEQVGRTDSSEGPQLNNASMTGFDFTDLGPIFKAAGEKTGITLYKHEKNSDAFFGRSDNQALADAGIPAHTLCVAFVYPDYHQPGDHWDKVDYVNMARVDRMIALGLLMIADNPVAPKWNEANPKTTRYVQAWKSLNVKER